jgi:hypothetical protein
LIVTISPKSSAQPAHLQLERSRQNIILVCRCKRRAAGTFGGEFLSRESWGSRVLCAAGLRIGLKRGHEVSLYSQTTTDAPISEMLFIAEASILAETSGLAPVCPLLTRRVNC